MAWSVRVSPAGWGRRRSAGYRRGMASPPASVDADLVARKTWRTLEPLHGLVYFAPETTAAYSALGLGAEQGYFVSRSAPMGAVAPATVVATFFNFEPGLVHRCMDGAWDITTPEEVVAARLSVADDALRRMLGDAVLSPEMARAAELARVVAETASRHPEGRPLFAGHAELQWPEHRAPGAVARPDAVARVPG